MSYQADAIVSRILVKRDTGNVTLFAFDAGQELSEHTAPYDALVQVVEGEAMITVAGQPYRVGTGEMLIMPAQQPHAVKAMSRFDQERRRARGNEITGPRRRKGR